MNLGKLPNNWTDRDPIWHTYTDSSGNGHMLNKLTPSSINHNTCIIMLRLSLAKPGNPASIDTCKKCRHSSKVTIFYPGLCIENKFYTIC